MKYDTETGNLIPCLAESIKLTDNHLEMRVTLRKDARFNTADPLTSEDIKFTWRQFVDKKNATINAHRYRTWKDIEIIDPHTFIIYFKQPSIDWQQAFRHFLVGSKKYFEKVGEEKFHNEPIGSGPFRLVSKSIGEEYVLEAVENHYSIKPQFKNLII